MRTDNELPASLDLTDDLVDIALRLAVIQGRVTRTKDEEGRDVYESVPPS